MKDATKAADFLDHGGLETIVKGSPDDVFLTCASFEQRSEFVAKSMLNNYWAKRGIVYLNREFQKEGHTPEHVNNIVASVTKHVDGFGGLTIGSWEDELEQFKTLRDVIAPNGVRYEKMRITVDITTFNREALLATLTILRWAYPNALLRLVYVSPEEYNPNGRLLLTKEGVNTQTASSEDSIKISQYLWLSRGFRKMRNAIGFPGVQRPHLPSMLIMLPGYEVERALTVVDNLEPSRVLLGKATDSTRDIFYERGFEAKSQMLSLFEGRQPVREFDFSTKQVLTTFQTLKNLIDENCGSYNIFLFSMSTKPSVLATFLAAEQYPEIQLTCNIPGEYNVDDYSKGVHEISFFDLASNCPKIVK
jgi:hypothetical protein